MLTTGCENHPYRILAIDPGTDTLGLSVFDVDLITKQITLVTSFTFKASQWIEGYLTHNRFEGQDEKYLRLKRHGEHLYGFLKQYQPHLVVHESAFMGRFPKAYQGLTECLYELRLSVERYSPYLPIIPITPMEVKHYIGGVKKEEVLHCVSQLTHVINLTQLLPRLDEHAVDSIAIGYTKACQILAEF